MRIAALLAASLLVAGCSHTIGGQSQQTQTSTSPSTTSPGGKPPAPSAAPAAKAPISDVIAWIEAGRPADPGRYHNAIRDGATTALGDDIAFTAVAGKVSCLTDSKHTGGALVCLVSLTNPPPAPPTSYGDWQGGWVTFDGVNLQVGASRADPGPFINGNGSELANGDSLAFGDYRCRADQTGLYCVNYAHQSAARLSPAGVEPFGCLRPGPAPDGVGTAFSCS
ncbi:hypothetical protein [Mycobacterium paraseoulense]|uniref:LppI n=1 Tax=Mycobacterium paraseoulense TaxID=590652 RepID=A0A1X0IDI5_9MYCO|nr:hypothetical protein [Mycobacterium paraseoulense]MCV7397308.1 hypothetical protein [Mycobacterium paraseoulense]ORB43980.1 hypothetical protein BST39_08200 [Mycobacterium paraseoulense]BBZ69914.1 hypothetical protein MPRS_10070 [Mycobacterium paraseoulense]